MWYGLDTEYIYWHSSRRRQPAGRMLCLIWSELGRFCFSRHVDLRCCWSRARIKQNDFLLLLWYWCDDISCNLCRVSHRQAQTSAKYQRKVSHRSIDIACVSSIARARSDVRYSKHPLRMLYKSVSGRGAPLWLVANQRIIGCVAWVQWGSTHDFFQDEDLTT